MAIKWKLKRYLAEKHQIYGITVLQKKIIKKTGITISKSNLLKLINNKPKEIRLETMEVICSALECQLKDFCAITGKEMNPEQKRKLFYNKTPDAKRISDSFPSPQDYNLL